MTERLLCLVYTQWSQRQSLGGCHSQKETSDTSGHLIKVLLPFTRGPQPACPSHYQPITLVHTLKRSSMMSLKKETAFWLHELPNLCVFLATQSQLYTCWCIAFLLLRGPKMSKESVFPEAPEAWRYGQSSYSPYIAPPLSSASYPRGPLWCRHITHKRNTNISCLSWSSQNRKAIKVEACSLNYQWNRYHKNYSVSEI